MDPISFSKGKKNQFLRNNYIHVQLTPSKSFGFVNMKSNTASIFAIFIAALKIKSKANVPDQLLDIFVRNMVYLF